MRRVIVSVLGILFAASTAAAQTGAQAPPSIVTTGEATIRRPPDQAFIDVAVETRAKSPRDAQRQNADAMTAVRDKIVSAGIGRDAVRTTGYSIQQEFDFPNGRRVPREYVARNGLEIRLDVVERAGEILDAVVQAGATQVTGVRFDLKDRASVEREALKQAVQDARLRADALAQGANRTIERVLRIDDTRRPEIVAPRMMMAARAVDAAPTPVESGLIEVHAQVTLTVEIK